MSTDLDGHMTIYVYQTSKIPSSLLCSVCCSFFAHIFKEDPRVLLSEQNSKYIQVVHYIATTFYGFIHDKPFYLDLENGCCATKRRIDLRKLIGNTMLCIEVYENQHKSYINVDEQQRYDDLFMDFSGKYSFIRYNQDSYEDEDGQGNIHYLIPE